MDNLRFFLNFKNDNTGLVEVSEPVKFDNANFIIEQDSKRYGRDVIYGNEETSLEFYAGVYEINYPLTGLTHEFENLIRYYNDFGFESEVEFILQRDNVDFTIGVLDFETAETDQIEYFKCRVIQQTAQALVKRREDVKVDVFSNKDLDDNDITPVQTHKILLKAKPLYQESEWSQEDGITLNILNIFTNPVFSFCPFYTVKKSGIDDTLLFMDISNYSSQPHEYYALVRAAQQLTNINIKIKFSHKGSSGEPYSLFVTRAFPSFPETYIFAQQINDPSNVFVDHEFNINVPYLNSGELLAVFFVGRFNHSFRNATVEMSATSTAIDSVISGVRHIDYMKQCYKSASGLNLIAPFYDNGSEHYNNFVFNGKLIRQIENEAFYGSIKDNNEQLQELNCDYQINKDNVYIGSYNQLYTNNEAGAFLTTPDDSFKTSVNGRYALQTMEYKYKSFEQDKDSGNTIDAVHTSTQWLFSNKQTEGNLVVDIPFVRDPFEIEFARGRNILVSESTSLQNDDKVYIIDCVPIAPNTYNEFTRLLQYQEQNGVLKILSDGSFRWDLLGFNVGDMIYVNGGLRPVTGLTGSILTSTTTQPNSAGAIPITVKYPLTNVSYVNRTNEGFTLIDNILSGDNFSNLRYTIKRNLDYFSPYLKTVLKYNEGKLKNTYFKSNGDATTQFMGGEIFVEKADILKVEMDDAILTPLMYSTTLVADFEEVYNLLLSMQTINSDNSIGGFIRIMDNNGKVVKIYPKKLDYTWATAELKIEGEEKQESKFLTIDKVGSLIYINEVGYDETIIGNIEVRTKGEYIQLLDNIGVGLINYTKFDKISINSNIFSTFEETIEAILTL